MIYLRTGLIRAHRGTHGVASAAPDPLPQVSGNVIMDTRAGGAQDITTKSTLADALTASTFAANNANGAPYVIGFATSFEHNASGRAFSIPWQGGVTNTNTSLDRAGLDFGGILCCQYKVWYGRTTNGGGVGTVGFYDTNNAHKYSVWFLRDKAGGGTTTDNRHTWLNSASNGLYITIDNYVMRDGTSSGGNDATHVNDTAQSMTVNAYAGLTLEIWDGLGAHESATIASNTATQFTLSSAYAIVPDTTSKYRVLDPTAGASPPPVYGVGNYYQDNSVPTSSPNSGGILPIVSMGALSGQVVTMTYKITPESVAGAKDGRFEQWVNNTKVFDVQSPYARVGAPPLRWKEWVLGGPTWQGGPSGDCTMYLWDMIVWNPAS